MTQELIVIKSVEMLASSSYVWRALTETDKITQWMGAARVESQWEVGSDITFTGKMPNFNRTYKDRGTVLAVEQEKLLRYSHWSEMSRLPDLPKNRTIITFVLDGMAEKTHLTVHHENFHSEAEYKHANFFWSVALPAMKKLLET